MKKGNFELLEFKSRRETKPWVRPILSLMNETYIESNIYGYAPLMNAKWMLWLKISADP